MTSPSEERALVPREVNLPMRPASEQLADAEEKAKALKSYLDRKANPVLIRGERYPEYEDWQTVGAFYGYVAKVASTETLLEGGYLARAVVYHLPTGQEVSAAEATCGEEDDGDWPTKPRFQQRSMAQTRACSKALRNVLAWVMVLAGLRPTPAEEMTNGASGQAPPFGCDVHGARHMALGEYGWYCRTKDEQGKWCQGHKKQEAAWKKATVEGPTAQKKGPPQPVSPESGASQEEAEDFQNRIAATRTLEELATLGGFIASRAWSAQNLSILRNAFRAQREQLQEAQDEPPA